MGNEEIIKKIKSVGLCLMAHPDNTPDSEFADRIDDLREIQEALNISYGVESEAELFCSMEGKGFCPYEKENGECMMKSPCRNHTTK